MGLFDGAADGTRLDRRPRRDPRPAGDPRRRCRAAEPVGRAARRRLRQLAARGEDRRRHPQPRRDDAARDDAAPRARGDRHPRARRHPAPRRRCTLPERHLGLVLPARSATSTSSSRRAGEAVAEYIDLDRSCPGGSSASLPLEGRAEGGGGQWITDRPPPPAPPLKGEGADCAARSASASPSPATTPSPSSIRTGSATGATAGAELSFFSPLADEAPRADADAVFLPGGYPELHGAKLAAADVFRGRHDRGARSRRADLRRMRRLHGPRAQR